MGAQDTDLKLRLRMLYGFKKDTYANEKNTQFSEFIPNSFEDKTTNIDPAYDKDFRKMDRRNRKRLQSKRQRKGEESIVRNKHKSIGVKSYRIPPGADRDFVATADGRDYEQTPGTSEVLTSQADMASPRSKFITPVPTCSSAPSGVNKLPLQGRCRGQLVLRRQTCA